LEVITVGPFLVVADVHGVAVGGFTSDRRDFARVNPRMTGDETTFPTLL
jgi:hypothetical protein